MSTPPVAVLIPAYNAARTLEPLLRRLTEFCSSEHIIVVDDGSADGTGEVARRFNTVLLSHAHNRGKGAALQTGFQFLRTQHYEGVITMDADLQHNPDDVPRFIAAYDSGRYDVILGSRLHRTKGMPLLRFLSNTITTFLVTARTSAPITDSQSGFRFLSAKVLLRIQSTSPGFEAETELLIKAALAGFRFGSIPIDTVYGGERSHMTYAATTINFIKVLFKDY